MSFFVVKPLVTPYKRRIYKECDQCAHARTLTNQSEGVRVFVCEALI